MVKRLKFKIDKDGSVTVDVQGAEGASCEAMTAPFEALLGTVAKREYKDSYFVETKVDQSVASEETSHGG